MELFDKNTKGNARNAAHDAGDWKNEYKRSVIQAILCQFRGTCDMHSKKGF